VGRAHAAQEVAERGRVKADASGCPFTLLVAAVAAAGPASAAAAMAASASGALASCGTRGLASWCCR
jgi:hypothetical protein